ncbi:MAG: GIY-YIG nuclease family protein [Gammaproteobacteria bacterium]|nr:GIY-YIG nuclease family protein [Gammaproteobacteria bacterium]MDA7961767.1 GIY-YIG nuclease family protein [Gammaproteobacteria bacterium]MDA7970181.1 GIY-YIG nuclease family protein [Gammaproteobacteria bacterium]MDA7995904.1 GIY-YIG nuclease family protein [Gammaproteobacteria bacterium]MDA8023838.1 GIY-YIG nuclease family protein [Gammaproteobacteria bacterium]
MNEPYDTVAYQLKDGNAIVYIGITNDPEGREKAHRKDRKKFTRMEISRRMTRSGAQRLEEKMLADYRRSHGGKNPKYNKTSR